MPISHRVASVFILLALAATSNAIICWKCGQYSDGVGSITPCNNRSAARLDECPKDHKFCIKYVSELTTVRDCVPTCSEKEWWGARTYCCDTDECNAAHAQIPAIAIIIFAIISTTVLSR